MKLRATGFSDVTPPDVIEIRRAIGLLIESGGTFELRALPFGRSAICRSAEEAIFAVRSMSGAAGIYYTLNPCRPNLEKAAKKSDIIHRRWFLIDVDPVRAAGHTDHSATDEEKAQAGFVTAAVLEDLSFRGWPDPLIVDSGNGFHLLYRVDLPNSPLIQQWFRKALTVLATRHDCDTAKVDRSVHNAARISKLPGTWARKGPDSPDRPHRLARLAMVPDKITVVAAEQIKALIDPDGSVDPPDDGSVDPPDGPGKRSRPFRLRATAGSMNAYCRAALAGECARVALAPQNDRNNQLNRSAYALGGLLHLEGFSRSEVESQLRVAACRAGLTEREIAATIRSGLDAGIIEPRDVLGPDRNGKTAQANGDRVLDDEESSFTGQSGRVYQFPLIVRGEDVIPKRIRWLWQDRIPFGFLTLMAGRTGVGKSFVTLDIAARLSVGGEIPTGAGECFDPGRCLIISEDTHEYILSPRLNEAGANMKMIRFMSWEAMASFTLSDIQMIDDCYHAADEPKLVIIDPPTNFLGGKDEHRNAEVRGVLMGMSIWAMQHDLAVILITHCNKGIKKDIAALDRVIGSVAWASTSRIAHLFAVHPDESDQSVFLPLKSNIGRTPEGIAYRIESAEITARVNWIGPVDLSADDAVGLDSRRIPKGVVVIDWLADRFRERSVWPSEELRTAALEAGLSKNTLWTPQVLALPIRKHQVHPPDAKSYWVWELMPDSGWPSEIAEGAVPEPSPNGKPRPKPREEPNRFPIPEPRPAQADPATADRDAFRVAVWLREFLSGRPTDEGGVLASGRLSGYSEDDLRAAAAVIGVQVTEVDCWKVWSYRET